MGRGKGGGGAWGTSPGLSARPSRNGCVSVSERACACECVCVCARALVARARAFSAETAGICCARARAFVAYARACV
jgi:hypothetical protein